LKPEQFLVINQMFQAFEQLLIEQSILAVSVDTETT
jgi:hypothetical protein